jgi:hypothetical protein
VTRPAYFGRFLSAEDPENPGEHRGIGSYVGIGADSESEKFEAQRWEFHRTDYQPIASSALPAAGDLTYSASNVLDYDGNTAWVEGAKGDGIGESLTLTLPKPAPLSRVGIVNGYAKDPKLYANNNRVAELAVSIDGAEPFHVAIPDEFLRKETYFFDLPQRKEPVKTVKLTITRVHRGSKHADTAISEITLVTPLEKAPKVQPAR